MTGGLSLPCLHRHGRRFFSAALATAALLAPVGASAQGIGYEVSPTATQIRWDRALGLQDDYMVGGQLGLRFGRLAELRGYYLTRADLRARAAELGGPPGVIPPDLERDVRAHHFGADLRLNLLTGSVVPYLLGGGGVLRLEPDGLDASEQILVKAGGGVRLSPTRRLGIDLFAENWAFRLNRYHLFAPAGEIDDPDADRVRQNLALGTAVNVALGGDPSGPAAGLRGAAITVEPFAGRLNFADALGIGRQNLVGGRAGLELNRLVGLRGFYWRGINDDFNQAAPVQGFGGEVQFNLGSGGGVIPHLLAGAGQIEFRDGFVLEPAVQPSDRTMLILGGGLSAALTERLRIHATVRDYIFGEGDAGELRRTDQLLHNTVLSGGLSFMVGGRAQAPLVLPRDVAAEAAAQAELERLRQENERLRRLAAQRLSVSDTVVFEVDPVSGDTVAQEVRFADPEEQAAQRTIAVPVPEQGEIYIRFGPPGAGPPLPFRGEPALGGQAAPAAIGEIGAAELRTLIRDAVREEMLLRGPPAALPAAGAGAAGMTELQRFDILEQRLVQRLESTLARRLQEQERRLAQLETATRGPTTIVVPREVERVRPIVVAPAPGADPRLPAAAETWLYPTPPRHRLRPQHIRPYVGANLNTPSQFVFGSRLDLGPMWPALPVNVVGEAALGFGDEVTTVLVAGNLQYDFTALQSLSRITPYLSGGLGFWYEERARVAMNYGVGISAPVGATPTGPVRIFVEQQGVGIFERFRLLVGSQVVF
jgi:hypothetical protein